MRDEIFDRQYQAGREDLNAGLDRLFASIGRSFATGFAAAHRLQWKAPWARRTAPVARDVKCA